MMNEESPRSRTTLALLRMLVWLAPSGFHITVMQVKPFVPLAAFSQALSSGLVFVLFLVLAGFLGYYDARLRRQQRWMVPGETETKHVWWTLLFLGAQYLISDVLWIFIR